MALDGDVSPCEGTRGDGLVPDHVDVTVDTYPGKVWSGTVQSIAPASGSEFSILPAQNVSGNWVKVVQRIPVRIVLDRQSDGPRLRSGMSVTVEIDTRHQPTQHAAAG